MMEKENMWKKKKLCKGNGNVAMRKVRIFYNDPDATDSSGDDESNVQTNAYGERIKRIVREVYMPMSVGVGDKDGTKKIKGVRRTKAGKFVAAIRDPVQKKKLWLGTYATESEAHEAYRRKEAELNRTMYAVNKTNSSPATSCASEETSTGVCSHSMQVFDNVEDSGKDTICLMNELVLEDDELPNVEFEHVPKSSPLLDHYSQLDSHDDLRALTVKQLCENAFASLPSLDDEEFNYEESLMQQLDPRPTRKVKMNLELDKEGRDWLKSLK